MAVQVHKKHNEKRIVRKFAHNLRVELFMEHFGMKR